MQPFEFPTFKQNTGSNSNKDQHYISQYGEKMPQQNSVQGQKWQMPQKGYYSTNNYNQNQLNYIDPSKTEGQTNRYNAPQEQNFLQSQIQKQQSLSWQNPTSGINHFDYSSRKNLAETPHVKQQINYLWPNQQAATKQDTTIQSQKRVSNEGLNWPNQQAPQNFS